MTKKTVVKRKAKPATKKSVKRAKKAAPPKSAKKKKTVAKAKARRPASRAAKTPKPTVVAPPNSLLLGRVEDYFAKIGVIALTLQRSVTVGAHLHIIGHTTNFEQTLSSLQIDRQSVVDARPKDAVGIKVTARARGGDYVYLIAADA